MADHDRGACYKFLTLAMAALALLLGGYALMASEDQTTVYFSLAVLATISVLTFLYSPDYSDSFRLSGWVLVYVVGVFGVVLTLPMKVSVMQASGLLLGITITAFALIFIWRFRPKS